MQRTREFLNTTLAIFLINPPYYIWTNKIKDFKTEAKQHSLVWNGGLATFSGPSWLSFSLWNRRLQGCGKVQQEPLRKLHTSCPLIQSGFFLSIGSAKNYFCHDFVLYKLIAVKFMPKRVCFCEVELGTVFSALLRSCWSFFCIFSFWSCFRNLVNFRNLCRFLCSVHSSTLVWQSITGTECILSLFL